MTLIHNYSLLSQVIFQEVIYKKNIFTLNNLNKSSVWEILSN